MVKAISTVIASILMLMIVVALGGTTYLYVSGTLTGKTSTAFSLIDSIGSKVTIRNDGTEQINKITARLDGQSVNLKIIPSIIQAGRVAEVVPLMSSTLSKGTHTFRLCTSSMCNTAYLTITTAGTGKSCLEILNNGGSIGDGLYTINSDGSSNIQVYCDMFTDDGGWTLVVRALAGSQAHNVIGSVGTLLAPAQGTVAKLSNTMIVNIGRSVNSVYETRFLFDLFSGTYYYQWNNGYAADFSNQIPASGNPFEQTRKKSYGGSWINDLVTYSDSCSASYSPFSENGICWTLWSYGDWIQCHSGFGLVASCSQPWGGTENDYHRSGTMWVR